MKVEEKLNRDSVLGLEELLGRPLGVLDEGFVRLVDYMGSDAAIVQAARISYGVGTKRRNEDRGLIRYLMRHRHTTPFEMCEIKLHVRVPMDCWRQWIRHRTANVNEYSTRYSQAIDLAQKTRAEEWRIQSRERKQGSAGMVDLGTGECLSSREAELQRLGREVYEERLAAGVSREQARKDLPLSTYTEAYWKIDLHNLLHFLELRMSHLAQKEIRAYATVIGHEIVAKWCPLAWEAFRDYRIDSVELSGLEARIVSRVLKGDSDGALGMAKASGWLGDDGKVRPGGGERVECEEKLRMLGVKCPWEP